MDVPLSAASLLSCGKKLANPIVPFLLMPLFFLRVVLPVGGTICGSNAGANIVANLIIGPRIIGAVDGHLIGTDIMQWYCESALPIFEPKSPKIREPIPQTISESPLCHVSVGKWMAVADKPIGSPERKDRCARVTASVAYHLVELLNAWKDDDYDDEGDWTPLSVYGINAQPNCMECHAGGIPEAPRKKI